MNHRLVFVLEVAATVIAPAVIAGLAVCWGIRTLESWLAAATNTGGTP